MHTGRHQVHVSEGVWNICSWNRERIKNIQSSDSCGYSSSILKVLYTLQHIHSYMCAFTLISVIILANNYMYIS